MSVWAVAAGRSVWEETGVVNVMGITTVKGDEERTALTGSPQPTWTAARNDDKRCIGSQQASVGERVRACLVVVTGP